MATQAQSPLADPLAFDALRAAGIRALEQLAGEWTDFNTHDPGITILEQVCWVLTDLGYRLDHPIPDLLAEGGGDGTRGLLPPATALGCAPVTLADLRRLVLDVEGVGNCWIEPVAHAEPPLHHHPERGTIGTVAEPPETAPVELQGLWRVLIACADCDDRTGGRLRAEVARRLFAARPLCQDFVAIDLLAVEGIAVRADIEIGPVADPDALLVAVLTAIAEAIAPQVRFRTLPELLAEGALLEDLLEGPTLRHGFITDADLPGPRRPASLRVSDLIHVVMDVPGVRAVRDLRLARARDLGGNAAGVWQDWVLTLDPALTPRLAMDARQIGTLIRLHRERLPVRTDTALAKARLDAALTAARRIPSPAELAPALPTGRDRHVGRYRSMLRQFPDCYGVGPAGLSPQASRLRRAQMKQLKAYLCLIDQVLADAFAAAGAAGAQLAGEEPDVSDAAGATYPIGTVEPDGLDLDALRLDPSHFRERLAEALAAASPVGAAAGRTRRRLDHLLARAGEAFVDPPPGTDGAGLVDDGIAPRRALLAALGDIAAARGTAPDSLRPADAGNSAGLAERIRLKLGLRAEQGETLILVEHILLRAMAGDETQTQPLLHDVAAADPWSLRLSVVLPGQRGRFAEPADADPGCRRVGFRCLVEHVIRAETPAHLGVHVRWLDDAAFDAFDADRQHWHERRRASLAARFGIAAEGLAP